MGHEGESIVVGNAFVEEGTALYDTLTGSVLWVVCIGDASVVLEPAGRYADELLLSAEQLKGRIATGRFELETTPANVAP